VHAHDELTLREVKVAHQFLVTTLLNQRRVGKDALSVLYGNRWNVDVTFEESRRHLGVETQCQWSELAVAPTTPALPRLFSLVTLLANRLVCNGNLRSTSRPLRLSAMRWLRYEPIGGALSVYQRPVASATSLKSHAASCAACTRRPPMPHIGRSQAEAAVRVCAMVNWL
jgi:hypothetical protein